jgi:phosphohistidine phosphatase
VTDSRLIIMRHAKSEWSTKASSDFDRPLSKRGRRDGLRMAKWVLEKRLVPDTLVSSPALRARQTAEIVANEIGMPVDDIIWTEQLYEASLIDLLEVVKDCCDKAGSLLLVGHNPGLDDLLCFLASEAPAYTSKRKLMTTSAIAVLNYGAKVMTTENKAAFLEYLARPRELEK